MFGTPAGRKRNLPAWWHLSRRGVPIVGLCALPALLPGCHTVPLHQVSGPASRFSQRLEFGTPLSGAQGGTKTITGAPDVIIRARFWKLYYLPDVKLPHLAAQSTLMINNSAGRPTMAFPALGAGARFGRVQNSEAFEALLRSAGVKASACGRGSAALWPGMASAMCLSDAHGLPLHGKLRRELLALWVWQADTVAAKRPMAIGLAFEVRRFYFVDHVLTLRHQLQVLPTRPLAAKTTFAALLPFRFLAGNTQGVAILITIRPWKNTPLNQAISKASRRSILAARLIHQPQELLNRPDLTVAMRNLGQYGVRRASLVYLAGQTGANLTLDVAAVANAPVLDALVRAVAANTTNAQSMTIAELGWVLDKTTFRLLYNMRKAKPLPGQLRIALALHLGEAAWHASSLDEIIRGLASRHDYRLRIIKENLIYLEDSSPADRLTAYDWLKSRHLAPPGYSPLADNQARNAALDQAEHNAAYMRRIQQ